MLNQMESGENRNEMVAVAIDKDKGSQAALKWAVDHLLQKNHSVSLVHVKQRSIPPQLGNHSHGDNQAKELFLPFRCFCTRKNIKCNEVILEDVDITKALCDYVRINLIEILVVGAPTKNSFVRFKTDVPSSISKAAPEFCTVYVISKGKISTVQKASCPVPNPPHRNQLLNNNNNPIPNLTDARSMQNIRDISLLMKNHPDPISAAEKTPFRPSAVEKTLFRPSAAEKTPFRPRNLIEDDEIRSPFDRSRTSNRPHGELSSSNTDISFVSSGRPSTEHTHPSFNDSQELVMAPWLSSSSDTDNGSFGSSYSGSKLAELNMYGFSSSSQESANFSWSSSQNLEDVEAEMRRLKQELQQTIDMYSSACKEALTAKQKAMELQRWKMEEQKKIEEALLAEEAALAIAEREKAKSKAAIEAAEAAQRIAQLEAQKRMNAEMKALKEAEEKKKVLDVLAQSDIRYRKYNIEEIEAATENFTESRKIGEGGYGPVYKCYLNHTQVAVKVLRPDAAQGRSQFQQEVEVLSCIRHPNMVLLLGACPEYGCLVYEYMANGSLEDRLFRRGNTPVLPWQIRFRIAAEIGTGLLFLHQTKPEPLVHRDLKPANILLDRNFVSKISDVGLARLVPPSIADSITQYRMTATAGTFCYIDPEYQQTGMLGTKSDIYSFGILLLQIVTSKPPMGLTHHVERAIERGTFADFLDPAVPDWPVEEATNFAKLALKCAELRRKDRPDLCTIILPELERLRALAEERMPNIMMFAGSPGASPSQSQVSTSQDILSDPQLQHSGYRSSQSRSST